ncbi:MAG TPA: aminopeptidase N C-terminal domain-containing protein, partial [Gammaproteobacteria bacterium]|nr:aminopeptidase N C-terminal domain-containing protein [Gammaproteobacteria bacterium]
RRALFQGVGAYRMGREMELGQGLVDAFGTLLRGGTGDKALVAEALTQPDEGYLADLMDWPVDPEAIHHARRFTRSSLARALRDDFLYNFRANQEEGAYSPDPESIARRRLKNLSLAYLVAGGDAEGIEAAREQFRQATNMTDLLGALRPMVTENVAGTAEALEAFYGQWQDEPEVVDKWFAIQAASPDYGTLDRVKGLLEHPAFNFKNPNKVRAVLGAFARGNPFRFHAADGEGYAFFADQVLHMDSVNPQMAAALVRAFSRFRRYDEHRQKLMCEQLERVRQAPKLSRDTYEIVTKSLGDEGG